MVGDEAAKEGRRLQAKKGFEGGVSDPLFLHLAPIGSARFVGKVQAPPSAGSLEFASVH